MLPESTIRHRSAFGIPVYSMLWEPSQKGRSSVVLQPHKLKVPELSATKRCGCRVVTLWEPSQKGCLADRPQVHQK
jgi:hypothetical protein